MGQLSALVYNDNSANASSASDAVRLYGPLGSVRILLQLEMAAISPVERKGVSQPLSYRNFNSNPKRAWIR